jgi:hypothetical protein
MIRNVFVRRRRAAGLQFRNEMISGVGGSQIILRNTKLARCPSKDILEVAAETQHLGLASLHGGIANS